jgi:2-polyprenyl-3-methyl-5-hydroxy-6-metoxy-1,4-benzoquinol methylase
MKQWYESLFENYARRYDQESFTQGTIGECDFIEKEINFDKEVRILDVGCGTGRHSIELARRGYKVVGVDMSEAQLQRAEEKARDAGVRLTFLKFDARDLPFFDEFNLVIMLCEGAFPLMETDEMNFRILHNVARALKQNGRLIFTTLNGLFPLFHSVKEFVNAGAKAGDAIHCSGSFDVMTFRDRSTVSFEDDLGETKELQCNERYYVPTEITWLLKSLGLRTVEIFGARLGAFSRGDELSVEDFEMLVVAGRQVLGAGD